MPVSETNAMLIAGGILSTGKLSVAGPGLAAGAVWVAVSVCAPSDRPVGVKLQAPVPSAIVVPRTVPPSLSVTTVLARPVPLIAGFEVIPSVDELPVSQIRLIESAVSDAPL